MSNVAKRFLMITAFSVLLSIAADNRSVASGQVPPPPPSYDVCIDDAAHCTPNWTTTVNKDCYTTWPSGCCQVKDFRYTCTPGGTVYTITHQWYNWMGACSGKVCS